MSSQQTVHDIEAGIEQEWAHYQNSAWMGSIPKDLITNFKKVLLESPPMKHQIHTKKIKEILSKEKTVEKLTYVELGLVINLILNSPLYLLSDDLDSALTKLERLEKVRNEYNDSAKQEETRLLTKKQILLRLVAPAGNGGGLQLVN